jgi:hypothetical protein
MHRTQIMLTDAQHARLKDESARTGRSLAELIRNALDERYAPLSDDERQRLFESAYGAWDDRSESGAEYVDRIRSGTRRRLSGAA